MRKIFFGILSLGLVVNCSPEQKVKSRLYISGINNCKIIFCNSIPFFKIIQNKIYAFGVKCFAGNNVKIFLNFTGIKLYHSNNFFYKINTRTL